MEHLNIDLSAHSASISGRFFYQGAASMQPNPELERWNTRFAAADYVFGTFS